MLPVARLSELYRVDCLKNLSYEPVIHCLAVIGLFFFELCFQFLENKEEEEERFITFSLLHSSHIPTQRRKSGFFQNLHHCLFSLSARLSVCRRVSVR